MDGRLARYLQAEKAEVIHLVEHSDVSIKKTLEELDIARSTFYDWYHKYQEDGYDGLICPHNMYQSQC